MKLLYRVHYELQCRGLEIHFCCPLCVCARMRAYMYVGVYMCTCVYVHDCIHALACVFICSLQLAGWEKLVAMLLLFCLIWKIVFREETSSCHKLLSDNMTCTDKLQQWHIPPLCVRY